MTSPITFGVRPWERTLPACSGCGPTHAFGAGPRVAALRGGGGAFVIACVLMVLLATGAQAAKLPKWVKQAAGVSIREYDKSVSSVVLLDERITTVNKAGRALSGYRYVVRLLAREGRSDARRDVHYDDETSIGKIHAWHIRPDGKVVKLDKDTITDESLTDDLYSDSRTKIMRFADADAGSIVAFEWVQKQRPFINQDYHFFQNRTPVVLSRYQLNLPADWRVESFIFNHAPLAPAVSGNKYVWEVRDLSPIKQEVLMPEIASISPYIAVSYFPAAGKVAKRSFSAWQDVSKWEFQLMDKQIAPNAAIEQKAVELTAGIKDDLEKARVISRWIQRSIRYVSIQLGTVGGYRPHAASVVFKKGYGDCKDKAALTQAMLSAVGISSYAVLVYSGDPTRIRPEFPSVLQFNHAIVAASIGIGPAGATDHQVADFLLFFDPTDDLTPLEDLPYYLQGSYGLVVRASGGQLVQLPSRSEEANTSTREITLRLQDTGGIVAMVTEDLTGQMAALARRRAALSVGGDYRKDIETRIALRVPGASVSDLQLRENEALIGPFGLRYSVSASNYATRTGNLMVVKPLSLGAGDYPVFGETARKEPVVFDMKSIQEDRITILVPDGFQVDEHPPDTELEENFGEFKVAYQRSGAQVFVQRRLSISKRVVPASDYGELKKFFDAAASASDASIVLAKR